MDTKKLRQKILDLAIRGKLVPQDPNDEPASVLLERIRAEKERLIKEGKIKRSKKSASDDEIEAPNGWVCCRFDEICSKFSTGPFGSMVHKSDYVSKDGTPIVNPMNIVEGKISTNNLMMVSNEKAQELDRYRLTKDDILIARRGDLRKCCIVTEDSVDWICGTGSFFLHVPFVEPRYIEFFYLSEYVQMILKRECVGATMDNLNQSVLGSIPFLLPPLSEQKRIVNAVERWFAVIDALESNEGDLLKTIDKAKSKILDLAIHGKLVPQDPNDEPAIDLLKRINPKFEPHENNKYEVLPSQWFPTKVNDICELLSGRDLPNDVCNDCSIGIPYLIGASNINDNKFSFIRWTEHPQVISEEGDVLISCKGTIGTIVRNNIGEIHIARQFMAIRPNKECISTDYLQLCLLSMIEDIKKDARGVIPGISRDDVLEKVFPLPPYQEQFRIVSKINVIFTVLDSIKESLEA